MLTESSLEAVHQLLTAHFSPSVVGHLMQHVSDAITLNDKDQVILGNTTLSASISAQYITLIHG